MAIERYEFATQMWRNSLKVPMRSSTTGLVLIRYRGRNLGLHTWFTEDGVKYKFGGLEPLQYVDERDVDWFLSQQDKREHPLFEVVQ